jgi:hypothetical protein
VCLLLALYNAILNYYRGFRGLYFSNRKQQNKSAYESVTQKVLFGNDVLAALMSGRK